MATINSTAFPKVALSKPPIICPSRIAASSVAKPSKAASCQFWYCRTDLPSGMIEMKVMMKMTVSEISFPPLCLAR